MEPFPVKKVCILEVDVNASFIFLFILSSSKFNVDCSKILSVGKDWRRVIMWYFSATTTTTKTTRKTTTPRKVVVTTTTTTTKKTTEGSRSSPLSLAS